MTRKKSKKKNKKNEKTTDRIKENSVKRIKWQPSRIYLVPKRLIEDEKEKLFNELSEIVFEMNQIFNLKPLEVYEK